MPDYRSPEAQEYRRWYKQSAWLTARRIHLSKEPLCRYCKEQGLVTAATTVDHIKPHKGNWSLFIDPTNHQSLCSQCHSSVKQSFEHTGRMKPVIGIDGWPLS